MSLIDLSQNEHLRTTGDLPSPKGAALAIIRQTQREYCALPDLVRTAKLDPAFVGRLIEAANSLPAGRQRPVVSVHDAIVGLGVPAVRSLALGFSLAPGSRSSCRNFDYERFWARARIGAIAFQALALHTHAVAIEEAFSVGLLARIGELALATLFPEEYSALIAQVADAGRPTLLELEQRAFAMTHDGLSAAMLVDWGLPEVFADPVSYCARPEAADFAAGSRQETILRSLVLADLIADFCLAEEGGSPALRQQLRRHGPLLSLSDETLDALCDRVAREWQASVGQTEAEISSAPAVGRMAPSLSARTAVAAESPEEGLAECLRCLVVDDDPSMRAILKNLLGGAGHEVFEAGDGRQALEMALELRPQIMIVDWLMPEMDGLELTRALRQTKVGRAIYIFILTGLDDDEKLVQAFEAGVDDFMTKPLKPRLLAARLRAGQRVVWLQHEVERDREEIRRFAAELAVTNRRLQEASLSDAVTGLPNRRYAMDRLRQEWQAATRSGRPLACMMIDVDGFKAITDDCGPETGDRLLRQTASALKIGLRGHDIVCHTGGDGFLVVCPDTSLDAVLACAERVRQEVEAIPAQADGDCPRCSVSIGVAMRDETMSDSESLLRSAIQSLRRAKHEGRNCVRNAL